MKELELKFTKVERGHVSLRDTADEKDKQSCSIYLNKQTGFVEIYVNDKYRERFTLYELSMLQKASSKFLEFWKMVK